MKKIIFLLFTALFIEKIRSIYFCNKELRTNEKRLKKIFFMFVSKMSEQNGNADTIFSHFVVRNSGVVVFFFERRHVCINPKSKKRLNYAYNILKDDAFDALMQSSECLNNPTDMTPDDLVARPLSP